MVDKLLVSRKNFLDLVGSCLFCMGFMNLLGHSDEVLDQLRQDLSLRCRIEEQSRIDIDLQKDRTKVTIEHEIKAKDLETSELLV